MATTIATAQGHEQFFYLRISGLPYYIFSTINPSDASRYFSFAWPTPTDYPSDIWARRGLQLPEESLEQKMSDMIGGVASPARMRLSVVDFQDPRTGATVFSRLFAPGYAESTTSVQKAPLSVSLTTSSSTIEVQSAAATFVHDTDVYIGAETIGISSVTGPDGSGASSLTIAARNKYVCYGNNSDDATTAFPQTPYHRIRADAEGNAAFRPLVSSEAIQVMGRTAALWMGILDGAGNPQPESESKCLLLGRIIGLEIGKNGGAFDITIESITADLQKAKIAPDLAADTLIGNRIYVSDVDGWNQFRIFIPIDPDHPTFLPVSVAAGSYTVDTLCEATNTAIADAINASSLGSDTKAVALNLSLRHAVSADDGEDRFEFSPQGYSPTAAVGIGKVPDHSFLLCLGFTGKDVIGPRRSDTGVPGVFIPLVGDGIGTAVELANKTAGQFVVSVATSDVRLGNGALVQFYSTNTTDNTISLGSRTNINDPIFYYVPPGAIASVEQVFIYGNVIGAIDLFPINLVMGRLIASTTAQATDGVLNAYPEGIGLGWLPLMISSDWNIDEETATRRTFFVDRSTAFLETFNPILREYGYMIIWDPDAGKVRLRRISIPQRSNASTFMLTESNRSSPTDRTLQKIDRASLRTSWQIKYGWDWYTQKFTQGPLTINDTAAISRYPNDGRQEEIEDKTLAGVDFAQGVALAIAKRLTMIGFSWSLFQRTVNKTGMLMSPGTIHQIVDATAINPFSGATEITANDSVYGILTSVTCSPATGQVSIELMVNSSDDNGLYRPWSPVGLIDFSNNSGGYAHGYNSSTKTLAMLANYGQGNDALDFEAGDAIRVVVRDTPETGSPYEYTDTVSAIGATTITVTSGLGGALSSTTDSIVMLQPYGSATASRKTGASKVAFQGNGVTRVIGGDATARLHHWS